MFSSTETTLCETGASRRRSHPSPRHFGVCASRKDLSAGTRLGMNVHYDSSLWLGRKDSARNPAPYCLANAPPCDWRASSPEPWVQTNPYTMRAGGAKPDETPCEGRPAECPGDDRRPATARFCQRILLLKSLNVEPLSAWLRLGMGWRLPDVVWSTIVPLPPLPDRLLVSPSFIQLHYPAHCQSI